ncbi:MAG: HU family DNA-binding protein, partial [Ignavibacteria bacterium]|nr:HU family DNA-binding protein [Ignavibacteria bacterium]
MTGKDIVKNIALKFSLEENAVEEFVGAVTGRMLEAFRKGKGVNIPGFGKFFVIPKTAGGIKIKTVSFSPSRKFADSVNEDFSDLVPEIISAGTLKVKNEIRVAEVPYEIEGTDFTFFVFDEDEIQEEVREQDEIQEEKISETVQAETPLTAYIQYTGQDITEEFDLQVEEEQSIQGIPETAEPEVQKDAETQEGVIPDAQTVFAEPRYFKYSGVPEPPETELIADESEQDFFIDEAPVAEEQQSLTGPDSFIADKEQDFEYPFDSVEASIDKDDDIILIKPGTQEEERGESYGITGFTLDKPFFKSAVFGNLHPEELKDDIVADEIESEILNLLKEREELILSLNLLEGITATKDDVLTAETGTSIEEETAEELITEPEITEPEITEPEITEPEITEPEITE